jgi:ribose transport system substrate-binding protein
LSGQRIVKRAAAKFVSGGLALALCVAVAVVGCNRESGSGKASTSSKTEKKFAFVTNNVSEFWKQAAAGVHKYEKEAGVTVDVKMPTTGKVEEQNQILENLVVQGYDGIAVSVIAPDDQVSQINKAAAKTNVICFDSDCPKSNRLAYIGTDNRDAGKVLGEAIVKLLPNGGKMAVFVGTFSADNAKQRLEGIEDVIKGHNITIAIKKEDAVDVDKARTNVEDVLNGYPEVTMLVGLWSYNGTAIAKAIDASGKKGKILAAVFDGDPGTLEGIQNGTLACTVVQKPFEEGYLSAKLMNDLATKGKSALPNPPVIATGVQLINKGNVDSYMKQVADETK